ncbi:acetate--CoA ligase family protein [Burkholderiaceae bacterium FT117]|uniref:acetate--CoA ligase family protein n=1 Tax=Zeimonas sediminis TaxID=2944268 RepID=UPI002342C95E|nr:acetate--CoA ligase family protein [Zeimonas sediminis]MCM5570336.1 acetate--CoA ligase family protein [Zeimonas sediminis]
MDDTLQFALAPRSVAVIGASDDPNKIGGRPIHYMLRHGFAGRILPVNPSRAKIQGIAAFASLAALPETPELAVIAVAGEAAVEAVEACAKRGVRVAVIIASGFGETGAAGRAIQQAMVTSARAHGMRLVGPNTQGIANFGNGAIANFSTMFGELPPLDGPVAICSQSGGMSQVVYGLVRNRGIGVRHVHATGNEADLTVADFAVACALDPDVRLILLYLESIAEPERLARAAAIARERDVPIVAIKAGRSASGQRAASSHTGALANEDRVVDAFLRRHGIWRARDPHALALAAEAYLKGWRPEGRRLVVISNSGASCVLAADEAEALSLPLAELAPETRAAVAAKLPGFASAANPIDITAALLQNSRLFGDVLPVLAGDPAADLFFIDIPVAGAGYDVDAFARDTAGFAQATGKPVVVAVAQESIRDVFRAAGVVAYADGTDALNALAQLASHTELMRAPAAAWPGPERVSLPEGAGGFLDEAASLAVLEARGLPVVAHRLCRSADEARAAFAAIGGPVAVKACSADVPHKSEHGLVALGVADEAAAIAAFEAQSAKLDAMRASRQGVIVAEMRRGRHEFMVGARIDPVFGPVVLVGDGGRYVEALKDFAILLPPFDAGEVLQALHGLRIAPLFGGLRGEPPMDLEALAAIAVGVGRLLRDAQGSIASIDLNPVIVGAAGEGAVIVDALVERG